MPALSGATVPSGSILLLETDPSSGEIVRTTLNEAGYKVIAIQNPETLASRAAAQHLVILDVSTGGRSAQDICRELRAQPNLASVPILCISQTDDVEDRIRFLEAGADDVMARPFDARELEARVESLLLRFQRSLDLTPLPGMNGAESRGQRVIVCFSPKGGVGTTLIAVNIAAVATQLHPARTLLVDLDLQFGQVATHLNLPIHHSLADLTRDEEALRDIDLMRTYITSHDSGLEVLTAPGSPELAQLVTARHIDRLLATAGGAFDVIVIDAGSNLDERTLMAFEQADCVIMPLIAELGCLRAISTLLDFMNETTSAVSKTIFILNNLFSRELLKTADIENAVGTKMSLELVYDPLLYVKAINEGVPVVTSAPKSNAADRLTTLATMALGGSAEAAAGERRRGIGSLLHR